MAPKIREKRELSENLGAPFCHHVFRGYRSKDKNCTMTGKGNKHALNIYTLAPLFCECHEDSLKVALLTQISEILTISSIKQLNEAA